MRFPILLMALLLGGCVVNTAERDGLPTGVTLLDSDEGYCDGPIEFDSDPDVVIEPGETTTLALGDGDDVEWTCLSDMRDHDTFDCPDGTSYVRITREEDAEEFALECYGS